MICAMSFMACHAGGFAFKQEKGRVQSSDSHHSRDDSTSCVESAEWDDQNLRLSLYTQKIISTSFGETPESDLLCRRLLKSSRTLRNFNKDC